MADFLQAFLHATEDSARKIVTSNPAALFVQVIPSALSGRTGSAVGMLQHPVRPGETSSAPTLQIG